MSLHGLISFLATVGREELISYLATVGQKG